MRTAAQLNRDADRMEKGAAKNLAGAARLTARADKIMTVVDKAKSRLMARETAAGKLLEMAAAAEKIGKATEKEAAKLRKQAAKAPTAAKAPKVAKAPKAAKAKAPKAAKAEAPMVLDMSALDEPTPISAKEYEARIKAETKNMKKMMKDASPMDVAKAALDKVAASFRVM